MNRRGWANWQWFVTVGPHVSRFFWYVEGNFAVKTISPHHPSKSRAAVLSIASNSLLILLKIVAGIMTGSVSIIAEAVHSALDLAAALMAFFSVRMSDKPADSRHPFGHGKIESVSGFLEALLILVAAGIIFDRAIDRIQTGASIEFAEIGIAVMAVSMPVNIFVSRRLYRVSHAADSLALQADAGHLAADVFASAAVVVGLVLVRLTGLTILDPVVAIGVGLYILKIAYDLLRKSFGMLVDERLPAEEEREIDQIIMEHASTLVSFHDLRTRKVGSQREIDLHLVMGGDTPLSRTHEMCDHIEADIESRLEQAVVTIHVEPCHKECNSCAAACPSRSKSD